MLPRVELTILPLLTVSPPFVPLAKVKAEPERFVFVFMIIADFSVAVLFTVILKVEPKFTFVKVSAVAREFEIVSMPIFHANLFVPLVKAVAFAADFTSIDRFPVRFHLGPSACDDSPGVPLASSDVIDAPLPLNISPSVLLPPLCRMTL